MIKLYENPVYILEGKEILEEKDKEIPCFYKGKEIKREEAIRGTIAYSILEAHNTSGDMEALKLRFDSMASHDITFVSIIQTAKASGMERFPLPYVLTNCHNSLCAVGGTINEDDHMFGLSAAKKYGGIYVPPHIAVIHQYMRECMAGCGKMILGSDSHTRYGALGTMAIGEGGGELVKQLLSDTYDLPRPQVVAVYLDNQPLPGVGPQDIALAIIGAVFKNAYVKNKVMEFIGPGIANLSTDYRNGIDVMTTETTCLSSVWETDEDTRAFLQAHHREEDYQKLAPAEIAYYEGLIYVDLAKIRPMIALPFHPSNVYGIEELRENLEDILYTVEQEARRIGGEAGEQFDLRGRIENRQLRVQQGIIAGCAGGNYNNIMEAAHILKGKSCGADEFTLSVYPSSQAVYLDLDRKDAIGSLMESGAIIKTAFCGPCFGAGDTPAHRGLSIRHTTRNFPNREGSKPGAGQMSAVALMDARSVAASAVRGGILTPATDIAEEYAVPKYYFDDRIYKNRVYQGFGNAKPETGLVYGPNIKDWPQMSMLEDTVLLRICSKIEDEVTTTDELIPSGETSSYRSNPLGLAQFTLSRRDPSYVKRAKEAGEIEEARRRGISLEESSEEIAGILSELRRKGHRIDALKTEFGSVIYAKKPGDGSAREQAASCQRVLGGLANIAREYATKRYRSNLINWGMLPFQLDAEPDFEVGDYIYIKGIREALDKDMREIEAYIVARDRRISRIELYIADLTEDERKIIKAGSLINYNKMRLEKEGAGREIWEEFSQ